MERSRMIERLGDRSQTWDLLVVGGGATGLGVAVDAAARGYTTVLLEQGDLGQGTSSRSTKLVHGGVRYLRQGNIHLIVGALRERGLLLTLAPHLVHRFRFVVPAYAWWEAPYYSFGLALYDLLAGKHSLGRSSWISREQTLAVLPTIRPEGLRGGVQYYDGVFDDARLLVNLAQTAVEQGAAVVNYVRVERLLKGRDGLVEGVVAVDREGDVELEIRARVVVNATGPFSDCLRGMDQPEGRAIIAPSQGAHVVLSRRFLPEEAALMVPRTPDGRVLFAIPWHGHVIVGTTDTPVESVPLEPKPFAEEIDFLLDTAGGYLARPPKRADVLSSFAGIRPLVRGGEGKSTAALSRDHYLEVSSSGLVTICGGKWTTYRQMAEDTVNRAAEVGHLPRRPCTTMSLLIHGHAATPPPSDPLAEYGSDAEEIRALERDRPDLGRSLHVDWSIRASQVVWAVRSEMARTVDDVLFRRTRVASLDIRAAMAMAPDVAALLAVELGRDEAWSREQLDAFQRLATAYLVADADTP
jgi:glycerol-3-phosphate dehydrogenase